MADTPPSEPDPQTAPPEWVAAAPPVEAQPGAGGTNGFAIASLVFGIIGIVGGFVLAIIFGIVALVQIPKRNQKGRGLAIAGTVLGVLWGLAILGAIIVAVMDGAERDDSGAITEAGSVAVTELRTGDCANGVGQEEGEATEVDAVPCAEPHDGEVFATFDLPDGDFPGDDEVSALAETGCGERIADYSTKALDDDRLQLFYFQPTEDTWSDGDREVVCLATSSEGKLTGSLKD